MDFKKPRVKFTYRIKMLAWEVEKKLMVEKSPEEEACHMAIKNCLSNRDKLISELYMQLRNNN